MGKIDKLMNKYSVLKNVSMPPSPYDQGSRPGKPLSIEQFNWGNWGKVPDKLMAPWSAPTPDDLSSYIAPVQFQRLRHDVNMWREAVREAELIVLPYRVRMQRMYVDTILNPHVRALMERRKNLTLLREFDIVDKDGNPIDELTQIFCQDWFDTFVNYTLDALFFGYSLVQISDVKEDNVENVEFVRRFNVSPDRKVVSVFEYAVNGITFEDPTFSPYCVWIPTMSDIGLSKCGYGLLYKIANIELYHRQTLQQNADYCEMFVHPFRLAKTNMTQKDSEFSELVKMMEAMGQQPWGIVPKETEIEWVTDSSGTGWQSYGDFTKRLEGLMSKVILGHELALDDTHSAKLNATGGQSPQKEALEEIQVKDGKFIQNVVPNLLFPKLREQGMDIPEGARIVYKNNAEVQEQKERDNKNNLVLAQMLGAMKNAGFTIDEKKLEELSGIEFIGVPDEPVDSPAVGDALKKATNLSNRLKALYSHKHD